MSTLTAQIFEAAELVRLLHDVEAFIRKYVVLNDDQAFAVTLWAAHTHAILAADCTPYLQVTSATKGAGKTRLLEVLEPLVARPWLTGRTSAAALVRKVDADTPTLLLDESDAAFNGEKEYAEALRAILNTGYRRSGRATVCVGQGTNISTKDFTTFGARAIAGIGDLPGTIAHRSIRLELRRRTAHELCARWRERDGHGEAAPIHQRLVAWAGRESVLDALRAARPMLPSGLGDRQADVWEPLIAIADLAAGECPARGRRAAVALTGAAEDTDVGVELLRDVYAVFETLGGNFIASRELVTKLCGLDDRPWATWRKGTAVTGHSLARLLKPFGVVPTPNAAGTARGYSRDRFKDAWARYPVSKVPECQNPNENGHESPISKCQPSAVSDSSVLKESSTKTGTADILTLQQPNPEDQTSAGLV